MKQNTNEIDAIDDVRDAIVDTFTDGAVDILTILQDIRNALKSIDHTLSNQVACAIMDASKER